MEKPLFGEEGYEKGKLFEGIAVISVESSECITGKLATFLEQLFYSPVFCCGPLCSCIFVSGTCAVLHVYHPVLQVHISIQRAGGSSFG